MGPYDDQQLRTAAVLTSAAALDAVRPRSELVAENALLRRQILVLARSAPPRPRLFREDRLLLVLLARVNTAWRDALHLVQPDTVLRWHRDLFILFLAKPSVRNGCSASSTGSRAAACSSSAI